MSSNKLKIIRESLGLSKSELSRKARVSPITITRIEQGCSCQIDTKRKILQALGFKSSDADLVFDN